MRLPTPRFDFAVFDMIAMNVAVVKLEKALLQLKMTASTQSYHICTLLDCDVVEGDLRKGMHDVKTIANTVHKLRELICEWCWQHCGKRDMAAYFASLNKGQIDAKQLQAWRIAVVEAMITDLKAQRTLLQTPSPLCQTEVSPRQLPATAVPV